MTRRTLEQQIGPLIAELEREVAAVNPLHLISLLSATEILSNSIPGSRAGLPDGFSQKFHYICSLAVSLRHSITTQQYNAEERLPRIGELTDTLFHTYAALWGERQDIRRLEELYDKHKINSGFVSFVRPLFEPKLGSTEQLLQFTLEHCEHFDSRFFVPELGPFRFRLVTSVISRHSYMSL